MSNSAQIAATLAAATALWAGTVGLHAALMPRPALIAVRDLKGGKAIGFGTYLYFAWLFVIFSMSITRLHPRMGQNFVARLCWFSLIGLLLAVAELFIFASAAILSPQIREAGEWVWVGALLIATALAPTMLWTLAAAAKKRKDEENAKLAAALDFIGEGCE